MNIKINSRVIKRRVLKTRIGASTHKNHRVHIIKKRGVNKMDMVVSTKTLFQSNKDYSKLDHEGKRKYINDLSKEFISSAHELLDSLKDK